MKKIILLLLILSSLVALTAEDLSVKKGLLLSAITPGLGQLYSGEYTKSGIFLSAEIAVIFSYFRFQAEKEWSINSYQKFAHNTVDVPKNSDDNYYQLIQDYISSEDYNSGVESYARNVFLCINSPYFNPESYYAYLDKYLIPSDMAWNWQNNKNWNHYKTLRRKKQDYEIYANFAIAAAILNRLVSIIDSAITINKINRENSFLNNLDFQPDWKHKGIKISYEFKF